MYQTTPYPQNDPQTRALNIVKSYFSRQTILFLAVVLSINVLISVISSGFNTTSTIYYDNSYMNDYLSPVSLASQPSFSVPGIILGLILNSINIVMIIGLFMIYSKSKNKSPMSSPSTGFTIMFVSNLILLILLILSTLFLLFTFTIFGAILSQVSPLNQEDTIVFLIIACILILTMIIFAILNYSGAISFWSNTKKSLTFGRVTTKGCSLFGVLSVIMAIFSTIGFVIILLAMIFSPAILDAMGELNELYPYSFGSNLDSNSTSYIVTGITYLISSAVTVIANILYAVVAFGYKKHVKLALAADPSLSNPAQPQAFAGFAPQQSPYSNTPYGSGPYNSNYPPQSGPSPHQTFYPPAGTQPMKPPTNQYNPEQQRTLNPEEKVDLEKFPPGQA